MPRERDSLETYAFSLEHPFVEKPLEYLHALREAHQEAKGDRSMPSAFSVAFSTSHPIPHAYGVTAPHNKTRPRPSTASVNYLHSFREQEAFTNLDVDVPQSLYSRRCTHCAEYQSLPPIFQAARQTTGAVSITTITILKNGRPREMCRNCEAYVQTVVDGQPGLVVIDEVMETKYMSLETERMCAQAAQAATYTP